MTSIVFNQVVKHDKREFAPGVAYDVDADAANYFITAGWAEETPDPASITVGADEIAVDPSTIWGNGPDRGKRVLG